jgi:hypothetical protein
MVNSLSLSAVCFSSIIHPSLIFIRAKVIYTLSSFSIDFLLCVHRCTVHTVPVRVHNYTSTSSIGNKGTRKLELTASSSQTSKPLAVQHHMQQHRFAFW